MEMGVLLAILFRLGHTLTWSPILSANWDALSIVWAIAAPLSWTLTTLSVSRGTRRFPPPGVGVPRPEARWVPKICPICRS